MPVTLVDLFLPLIFVYTVSGFVFISLMICCSVTISLFDQLLFAIHEEHGKA